MNRPLLYLLAAMLLLSAAAPAQQATSDGLTILVSGQTYTDDQKVQFALKGCQTKYKEPVVGFWFQDPNGQTVRFYANAKTWDSLKQVLVRARDDWETLTERSFAQVGEVQGYRVANRQSTLRINLQGQTALQAKELLISASGGPDKPRRLFIHLNRDELKSLVEEFTKIDDYYRKVGGASGR